MRVSRASRFVYLAILVTACAANPERVKREALESGNRYAASRQFPQAVIEYRRAVQADGRFGEARKQLAAAYLETGDFPKALGESVRAADLLPQDVDAQITAGNMLLAAGRYEDAKTRAEQVLAKSPGVANAHVLRGNALAGLRNIDAALTEFEEAAAASPKDGLIHVNLGALHMARGAQAAAEAAFRKAIELSPDSPMTRVSYANFLLAVNRASEAEAELKAAALAAPDDVTTRRALAALYLSTGRVNDAEPHLRKLADISSDPKARFALARYYFATNRADDGFRELKVLAARPDSYAEATLQMARAQYAAGRTADGYALLNDVLRQDPENPTAQLVKAQFLVAEHKWTEAITAARAAVDRDPRLVEGFYLLGLAQQGIHDFESAKKSFAEVLRLEPGATRAQVALADLYLLLRNSETAQQLAGQAAKRAPGAPEVRTTLIRSMLANGDFTGAETAVQSFKADFPQSETPYVLEGTLRYMRKDFGAAERAFRRAAEIAPESAAAASGLVQVMLATGRGSEAKQLVHRLTTSNSARPEYLILAARTYATLREFDAAEPLLRKVLTVDPARTDTYSLLAQLYVLQNKLDDALPEYQNLAARDPKSVSAQTMVGTILQLRNRRPEAKAAYRKVLAVAADSPVAANNLAWMMAEDGEDLDLALQLAQAAKAGLPDSADATDTLGLIYLKKGLTSQAVSAFREAVASQPDRAEFKYRLGQAYARNGDFGEARRMLETALAQNAKSAQAEEARATLARLAQLGS